MKPAEGGLPLLGRDKELAEIEAWGAGTRERALALVGPPGAGKSALLRAAVGGLKDRFRSGTLWVDLGALAGLEDLESALAEALEISLAGPGASLEKCAHCLKEREALLVLDGAEAEMGAASKLAQLLRAAPGLRVLAASRRPLDLAQAREMELKGLAHASGPASAAAQALRSLLEARGAKGPEPGALAGLAAQAEGLPAALALLAGLLAEGGEMPGKLAGLGLASLPKGLRWALEASLQGLPAGGREALAALACLRADFGDAEAEAVAPGCKPLLAGLEARGLLLKPRPLRHALPRWLREALAQALPDPEAATRHRRYYAQKAVDLAPALRAGRQTAAAEDYAGRKADMLAALDEAAGAGDGAALRALTPAACQWLELKGFYQFGATLFQRVAGALKPGEAQSMTAVRAAWFAYLLSPGPGTRDAVTRAASAMRFRGDAEEEGYAALALSSVAFDMGDATVTRAEAERAAALYHEAKDRWGEAWATLRLGQVAELGGGLEDAAARYRGAMEAFHGMACADGEAWGQYRLGSLYEKQGLLTEAEACLSLATRLFEKLKLTYFQSMALVRLAHVLRARAKEAEALELCQRCLRLFKDVRNDEGEAWCRFYLGDVAATQHRDAEAQAHTETALALFKALRQRDGMAWSQVILAMLAARAGDALEARRHGSEGESIFRELGQAEGQAACQRWIGLAEEKAGRSTLAEAAWRKALKLAADSGVAWRVAELAGELGRLAEAKGDAELAAELCGLAAYDAHSPTDAKAQGIEGLTRLRKALGPERCSAASRRLLHQGAAAVLKRLGA